MVRWFDGSVVRWFDGSMVLWFEIVSKGSGTNPSLNQFNQPPNISYTATKKSFSQF